MGRERGPLVLAAAGLLLGGALVACTASQPAPAPSTSSSGASRTTSAPAQPVLTGFGALRADWDRTHTVVVARGCSRGSAYDENLRLDAFPGCPGSEYGGVDGPGDRVEAYVVNFPAGTTLQQTLQAQARELPSDAVVVWQATLPDCTVTQYRSPELGRLDPADIPGGLVGAASETTPQGRRYLNLLPFDMRGRPRC